MAYLVGGLSTFTEGEVLSFHHVLGFFPFFMLGATFKRNKWCVFLSPVLSICALYIYLYLRLSRD